MYVMFFLFFTTYVWTLSSYCNDFCNFDFRSFCCDVFINGLKLLRIFVSLEMLKFTPSLKICHHVRCITPSLKICHHVLCINGNVAIRLAAHNKRTFQLMSPKCFFLIVAPCILIYVEFTHQQMHFILKNTLKFTLKYT